MNETPSSETLTALRGIQTEIGAGKILFPKDDIEQTWNNAHDRALSIVSNYMQGFGLFQMTERIRRRQDEPKPPEEPAT